MFFFMYLHLSHFYPLVICGSFSQISADSQSFSENLANIFVEIFSELMPWKLIRKQEKEYIFKNCIYVCIFYHSSSFIKFHIFFSINFNDITKHVEYINAHLLTQITITYHSVVKLLLFCLLTAFDFILFVYFFKFNAIYPKI